jgi:AcrR family transcriptional regulator
MLFAPVEHLSTIPSINKQSSLPVCDSLERSMTVSPPRVRRTQEERSRTTRNKILDAAIDSLIELGYAATSTPEVCRRAGVSRGALLHHFPTREELVTSAITHLADRRARELRAHARTLGRGREDLDNVLGLMWSAFTGPLFQAALELWVAARADAKLHQTLYPMERAMGRSMHALWRELLPDPNDHDARHAERDRHLSDLVTLTQHLLRGMALQRILKSSDGERARLFELWKQMARRELISAVRTGRPKRRDL